MIKQILEVLHVKTLQGVWHSISAAPDVLARAPIS
jgi:hypothetical protein